MSAVDRAELFAKFGGHSNAGLQRLALPIFIGTIGLSAFLLFAVQPMFTKMVTPSLGGTPAVWSVAMVFFQAVLLAGYGYAHLLVRHLPQRLAIGLHLSLVVLVYAVALPIAFDPSWAPPTNDGQSLWLIGIFTVAVGLPFFAVAANGPLLQSWYAATGGEASKDPYFLYQASNFGSFLALLAYPFVIEPQLTLAGQSSAWGIGYCLLGVGLAACGLVVARDRDSRTVSATPAAQPEKVASRDKLTWTVLGLVPSALLVAVTAHISTDVAAAPLLWIVPLALFLLSFVLAFSTAGQRIGAIFRLIQPALAAVVALLMIFVSLAPLSLQFVAHILFFFVSATIFHAELHRRRPPASQLSVFYFFLSLGGVIGGAFASLLAPVLFNSVIEYPLLIVAALACRPGLVANVRAIGSRTIATATVVVIATVAAVAVSGVIKTLPYLVLLGTVCAFCVAMVLSREAPVRLIGLAVLIFAIGGLVDGAKNTVMRTRSFFGVHTVTSSPTGHANFLLHGNTVHGAEFVSKAGASPHARPVPASYFNPGGVFSGAIDAVRTARGGRIGRVAVIGLGMGALACHAQDGETWDFYEIDPTVVRLARDRRYFQSMSICTPNARTIVGDGRLTLAKSDGVYDLIIVDAFSSNSIPVHLLTREALALYAAKLGTGGAVIFNISNRHMLLQTIVAAAAAANGLATMHAVDLQDPGKFHDTLISPAHVAVVYRRPEDIGSLSAAARWHAEVPSGDTRTWTDDYSNIIDPILQKVRSRWVP